MPAIKTSSSIKIAASADRVGAAVADFNTWPIWSPWLIMEPGATVNIHNEAAQVGHAYDWSGDKVGAGEMVITSITDNRLESDLTFLKPFKSKAKVAMDVVATAKSETEVTWHMDSNLPFFMFFMTKKMTAMIRNDYERGLAMLKDYVEWRAVRSDTKLEGVVELPAFDYVGKKASSPMSSIADSMKSQFAVVHKAVVDAEIDAGGAPFAIYNKMDLVESECTYTACMPVSGKSSGAAGKPKKRKLNKGVVAGKMPACKAMKLVHTGPYRHLGNAWSMGMGELRHKKIKAAKQPPFEIYVNDPASTKEEALITEIYIPVKS